MVYGGTSSGITAAIQSSRLGKKVLLIEPGHRIGGLTTEAWVRQILAISKPSVEYPESSIKTSKGITKKRKVGDGKSESHIGMEDRRLDSNENAMWTFEPSAALKAFKDMISKENNITLVYSERLNRKSG